MTKHRNYFQLRRRIDRLVYEFDRVQISDNSAAYKRRDDDLWIRWHTHHGWIAWDGVSDEILGRSWHVQVIDQKDYPPEDVWVSCKDDKSYVYDLIYPTHR